MGDVVVVDHPDIVALIEQAAQKLTGGDTTEAVGLALRFLLQQGRAESLFGAHPGSVHVQAGVDLTKPALELKRDSDRRRSRRARRND